MSHLWTGSYPRNTSNGDYGRFLFTSNQNSNNNNQGNFTVYPSADGNRMVHHAHYPNCSNHQNIQPKMTGGNGSNGMPDYTIEYGEDAVRAALGGNMPDFQAQFMQQMNGGNEKDANGVMMNPQNIQMMNNGKSRVAMIPVVFDDQGDENQQNTDESSGSAVGSGSVNRELQSNVNIPQPQNSAGVTGTEASEAQSFNVKPPKKESIINAYDSVRKVRSTGQVKYGRHIRPSYWNPQIPNPCRKKMGGGDFLPELPKCSDEPQGAVTMPTAPEMNIGDVNGNGVEMRGKSNNNCYTTPSMNITQQYGMQQGVQPPPQRARSMPMKKHTRPTNSLCGKCSKCKNLSSNQGEPSLLTFPAYSPGTRRPAARRTLTSSDLGQSAKNFRAIRFSSN
ncbi:unnamed protein product [Orchesella dallaii]|uniref:Uncharacterized protein n=1 Tax=Orchesella dallaii TaxID=48710 RepID=A0ABP1QPX2_9HEXA